MSVLEKILEIEAKITRNNGEIERKKKERENIDEEIKDLELDNAAELKLVSLVKELILEQQNAFDKFSEVHAHGGANDDDFREFAQSASLDYNTAEVAEEEIKEEATVFEEAS